MGDQLAEIEERDVDPARHARTLNADPSRLCRSCRGSSRGGQGRQHRCACARRGGLRAGLIALLARARGWPRAVVVLIDHAHRQPARASGRRRPAGIAWAVAELRDGSWRAGAIELAPGACRAALGIALAVQRGCRWRGPGGPLHRVVQAPPSPHYLSSADLTSPGRRHAAATSRPPIWSATYTPVASRYEIPGACWPRSNTSRAATSTRPPVPRRRPSARSRAGTDGQARSGQRARTGARCAAAAQPSAELVLDAKRARRRRRDAEFGAGRLPTSLSGTGVSAQTVLTLAQAIDSVPSPARRAPDA